MERYLSPLNRDADSIERISLDGEVGIFRENKEIYAKTQESTIELGLKDTTVSRRENGDFPINIVGKQDGIEVHNNGNANGVSVETGVKRIDIPEDGFYRATSSATVTLGYNTELRLTIEQDPSRTLDRAELEKMGLIGDGPVIQGVQPAVYVQAVADNLRRAGEQSPSQALKYLTELHNFVNEHPLNGSGYETMQSQLGRMVEQFESKVSRESLRGTGVDEERREQIDRITHQAERLYSGSE